MVLNGKEPWMATVAGALAMSGSSAAEESKSEPDVPRRPNTSSFHFASTFQGEDALRTGEWVLSEDAKYEGQDSRVRVEPCNLEGGVFAGDFGLLLDEAHKHYAVGATLPKPFDNAGKDLVMQYEVQVRGGAKCGGAYVKMLRGAAGEDMTALNNETPYSIMFGPDKCFSDTNKVHFIFQHENPLTYRWEEKHAKKTPKIKDDKGFHLYTLHVKAADNTFDLYIDGEVASSGSLLEDMEPPVLLPKEIDDPDDVQPEDWVTEAMMDDPSAVKPDDWAEDAPERILDEGADMPEGWLEDEEKFIADPKSTVPTDWDEEEDGEWDPVMMANPLCQRAPGCGKWTRPYISNPEYKGPWKPPQIENPDYKGAWSPRRIENPAYFDEPTPSNMAPITGLAIEIWSVDGGIWLDNFVVGDDVGAALKLGEETWRPKHEAYKAVAAEEKKAKDAEKAKKRERDPVLPSNLVSASRFVVGKARPYLPEAARPALDMAGENPIACIVTMLAGIIALLLTTMRKKRKPPLPRGARPTPPATAVAAAGPSGTAASAADGSDGDVPQMEDTDEDDQEEEDEGEEGDDEDQEEEGVEKDQGAGEGGETETTAPISSAN